MPSNFKGILYTCIRYRRDGRAGVALRYGAEPEKASAGGLRQANPEFHVLQHLAADQFPFESPFSPISIHIGLSTPFLIAQRTDRNVKLRKM